MSPGSLIFISGVAGLLSCLTGIAFLWTIRGIGSLAVDESQREARPRIDVIIPARNEQDDLEETVRGLLAQEDVDLRIFIVNDHSTDNTAAIADRLVADDDRVAVIHDPPLKPGWFGKVNAMQQASELVSAPDLLFCDADSQLRPRCLISAWHERERLKADLISLCPLWVCESFWENALLPHCLLTGTVQFMPPSVNDDASNAAAAAGAFILVRRDVFVAINGFDAVKTEMLDDLEFAKHVKRSGYRTRFKLAPNLISVRLFKDNAGAFWGLTKNVLGAVKIKWMAIPAMLLPIFFYWVPLFCVVWGVVNTHWPMFVAGLATYLVQLWTTWLSTRICRIRWSKAVFFPAAALPVICCFSSALFHWWCRGAVYWRGRVVSVDSQASGSA